MGLSWSSRRTNNTQYPSQLVSSSSSSSSATTAAAAASASDTNNPFSSNPCTLSSSSSSSSPPPPPSQPPNYVFAANAPYPAPSYPPQNPYHTLPPPPPPPHHVSYYQYAGYNSSGYSGSSNFSPYYGNRVNGWHGIRPPGVPLQPPPPYVDHQNAKKIKNDVNVHKDTIKLEVDETNPDCHLVSFTFDSLIDGSITIFYFAKEGANCSFSPLYPEANMHIRVPFQKGLRQKFHQPPGTGIDLGFFELDDLAKPSPKEDVFPLVISAEACLPHQTTDGQPLPLTTSPNAQITQAVLEKNGDHFKVRVIKQILWVDGVRYELRELYGVGNSEEAGFDGNDPGKECVICMAEPKDTAVLPCRHMCMCSDCAKELRLQSNKCPICRQPIEELLEIKVNKGDQ